MAVLVLTFISILLTTFALVAVVTRQSAEEKVVGAADGMDPPIRRRPRPALGRRVGNCSKKRARAGSAGWMKF